MNDAPDRSYFWVFYASVWFLFASVVLRSLLEIGDIAVQLAAILLLCAWLGLFVSEWAISRIWRHWNLVYLALQTVIIMALLSLPGNDDFFALLFAALSMQSLRWFGLRGAVCIAVFALLTFGHFLFVFDVGRALAFALIYLAVNIFLGAYALTTRHAEEARNRTRNLARELQTANAELTAYVVAADGLAVARERNRVARELHDSVTQTIFSMTLAGQSAAVLLDREPGKVEPQLDHLGQLAENALAEMRVLVSELKPDALASGDLVEAIRRDIDRRSRDGISISLEVEDAPLDPSTQPLSDAEQAALLRITQEAINNVAKHAGTSEAAIRLRLGERPRLEIRDWGKGFEPVQARAAPGMGLRGMAERAAEIGWSVEVESVVGEGTQVVAERVAKRKDMS